MLQVKYGGCNSLAPARLAPAGLPSAFDPAAPRPAVCLSGALNFFSAMAAKCGNTGTDLFYQSK